MRTTSVQCGEEGGRVISPLLRTSGLGLGVGSRGNLFLGSPSSCCDIIRNRAYSAPSRLLSVDQVMGRFPLWQHFTFDFPGLTEVSSKGALPCRHFVSGIAGSVSLPPFLLPFFFFLPTFPLCSCLSLLTLFRFSYVLPPLFVLNYSLSQTFLHT